MDRPEWQQSECPPWCTVTHADADHPDDRAHRDDGLMIPALFRVRRFSNEVLVEQIEAGHLVIGRWQRDGDAQIWRTLGDDHGTEIELDEQSFQRILAALDAQQKATG